MSERSKPTGLPSSQANAPVKIGFLTPWNSLFFSFWLFFFFFKLQTGSVWIFSPSDPSDASGFCLVAQSDTEVANFRRIPTSNLILNERNWNVSACALVLFKSVFASFVESVLFFVCVRVCLDQLLLSVFHQSREFISLQPLWQQQPWRLEQSFWSSLSTHWWKSRRARQRVICPPGQWVRSLTHLEWLIHFKKLKVSEAALFSLLAGFPLSNSAPFCSPRGVGGGAATWTRNVLRKQLQLCPSADM